MCRDMGGSAGSRLSWEMVGSPAHLAFIGVGHETEKVTSQGGEHSCILC